MRDDVLHRQFNLLEDYFPDSDRRGIRDRWKEVIKTLNSNGLIKAMPDFGKPYWTEFIKLVQFRDGLVHGKSSRPSSKSQGKEKEPQPSKSDLDKLEPGWATRTISRMIKELHAAVGSETPWWLVEI